MEVLYVNRLKTNSKTGEMLIKIFHEMSFWLSQWLEHWSFTWNLQCSLKGLGFGILPQHFTLFQQPDSPEAHPCFYAKRRQLGLRTMPVRSKNSSMQFWHAAAFQRVRTLDVAVRIPPNVCLGTIKFLCCLVMCMIEHPYGSREDGLEELPKHCHCHACVSLRNSSACFFYWRKQSIILKQLLPSGTR